MWALPGSGLPAVVPPVADSHVSAAARAGVSRPMPSATRVTTGLMRVTVAPEKCPSCHGMIAISSPARNGASIGWGRFPASGLSASLLSGWIDHPDPEWMRLYPSNWVVAPPSHRITSMRQEKL